MENLADLGTPSKSQCYRCRYWDWDIARTLDEKDGASDFIIICNSPLECTPGDNVAECPGFERERGGL